METILKKETKYKRLDMSKLHFSEEPLKYDDVINDVQPLMFDEDIQNGSKEIKITKAKKDYRRKCVKLEISC